MLGVLKSFHISLDQYADDVQCIVGTCIERYGIREWKLAVMTNEIHGHLGIYSTLGTKMGLFAREWFEKEGITGHISVVSFAGDVPPVSCLNDGLQISTGATVGHGLIHISDEPLKRAEAIFTCRDKTLRIKLKPAYEDKIREDIRQGVQQYGSSPAYWQYVRKLALRYWAEWNRNLIFELEAL